MTSVGTQLQQVRQERNLSLADVTRQTKIQPWVLEALEADRLQEIMSPVYVKGFLSSYARFLHLAPEPLIAQLPWPKSESEEAENPAAPPPEIPSVITLPQIPLPVLRRLGAVAAAAVAIVALVAVNPLRWIPKITLPVARAPTLASVTPVKETSKPPPLPAVSVTPAKTLELGVTAHSTTWIQVRADGKLVTQQRILRGANERWLAKQSLELVIAKPSQVELTLNGQSISPFAIAHGGRLRITHQGVTALPDAAP